jgi:tetratricopeptide (TPR) repeat protein
MMRRLGLLVPAILGLVLLGAAPDLNVERLLREGNAAFDRGDYEKAIELYDRAEDRATDPGQVAFNKATGLYRLALDEIEQNPGDAARHFREAEEHYRRSAEGADEPRRSRALFGLANSLVQGRGDDARALMVAVRCYRDCLRSPDRQVAEDARHNLELAKLLWLRVSSKDSRQSENESKNRQDGSTERDPPMNDQNPGAARGDPTMGRAGTTQGHEAIKGQNGENPIETRQDTPGPSNTLPPRDDDTLPPLTPEQADKDLAAATKQIRDARKNQRLRPTTNQSGSVKDW